MNTETTRNEMITLFYSAKKDKNLGGMRFMFQMAQEKLEGSDEALFTMKDELDNYLPF